MAGDDDKLFKCYWCGKPLDAEEVVPLMSDRCCGYTASCADCAKQLVAQNESAAIGASEQE